MARPRSVAGGRPVTVTVKMSAHEAATLDAARGGLSRSAYVRRMLFGPPAPRPADHPDPYEFAP
jgi:hypothetical protein